VGPAAALAGLLYFLRSDEVAKVEEKLEGLIKEWMQFWRSADKRFKGGRGGQQQACRRPALLQFGSYINRQVGTGRARHGFKTRFPAGPAARIGGGQQLVQLKFRTPEVELARSGSLKF